MELDKLQQIEKLNELKEKGIISKEEFEKSKRDILSGTSQQNAQAMPQIVIQNSANSAATATANGGSYQKEKRYSVFITFFLCLLGGWFGLHKFYTRETGSGVLYLLTFGIFGLGWFWDTVSIFFGFYRDGNGNALV